MKIKLLSLISLLVLSTSFSLISGCATTRTLDPASEKHYDAHYDFSDKKTIVDKLTASLLTSAPVSTGGKRPILIVYRVANETSEHINTDGISDDIRLQLHKTGKYRFINKSQRDSIKNENTYQATGTVDPSQRISQGKQLGADYILSGKLRSIEKSQQRQIRLTKKKMVYYSLNLELTDIHTGELTWTDQVELAREQSRPIIGW